MNDEFSHLNLRDDFGEVGEVPEANRWILEMPADMEVLVTLAPAREPNEKFQARLLWTKYPDAPPSLKFRDSAIVPILPRIFMRLLLGDIFADKEAGEDHIVRSDLGWTIVHPVMLTHGPPTGKYRVGERMKLGRFPTVSRSDVAHFLVNQLSDCEYIRRRVLISS